MSTGEHLVSYVGYFGGVIIHNTRMLLNIHIPYLLRALGLDPQRHQFSIPTDGAGLFSEVGLSILKLLPNKLFAEGPELPCLRVAFRIRFIDIAVIDLAITKIDTVVVYCVQ